VNDLHAEMLPPFLHVEIAMEASSKFPAFGDAENQIGYATTPPSREPESAEAAESKPVTSLPAVIEGGEVVPTTKG
jgi:hypothetical protein